MYYNYNSTLFTVYPSNQRSIDICLAFILSIFMFILLLSSIAMIEMSWTNTNKDQWFENVNFRRVYLSINCNDIHHHTNYNCSYPWSSIILIETIYVRFGFFFCHGQSWTLFDIYLIWLHYELTLSSIIISHFLQDKRIWFIN